MLSYLRCGIYLTNDGDIGVVYYLLADPGGHVI